MPGDNRGRPSADLILSEFQTIRTGDWAPMSATVSETTAFKVKAYEVDRRLLWAKSDSSWVWQLTRRAEQPANQTEAARS